MKSRDRVNGRFVLPVGGQEFAPLAAIAMGPDPFLVVP
jgi:hypothetical protein